MNYNERTGNFEKTACERVGAVLKAFGWRAFKFACLLAAVVCVLKVGQLVWR